MDTAIDRRQAIRAYVEIGKRNAVKRNAELDALRTLDQIGDEPSVVDVGGGEQFICQIDASCIPDLIDDSLNKSGVGR